MKNYFLLFIIITLSSCATKIPFKDISKIDAITINSQTKNRFFIPKKTYDPLFVRVNFIYLLDNNGQGNFNGKNKAENEVTNEIFKKVNELYRNLEDPKDPKCYKGKDFVKDTKIQFKFNSLYIKDTLGRNYRNSEFFNEKNRSYRAFSPSKNWYLKYLDNNINDTISKKGINAFLNMDVVAYNDLVLNNSAVGYHKTKVVSVSQFPSYQDLNRSSQICFPNKYTKFLWMKNIDSKERKKSWNKTVKYWYISSYKGISHEIGHSLSLAHSNKHHRTNKCKHAMMNQGWKAKRNYIPPTEIGKMHKALMTSNLIQFVTDTSNYNEPRIITENENWTFKTLRFYQDIIVKQGKILILNGNVILPNNASITLEKDAILVLNKAVLKTSNNSNFTTIIKNKNAKIIKY